MLRPYHVIIVAVRVLVIPSLWMILFPRGCIFGRLTKVDNEASPIGTFPLGLEISQQPLHTPERLHA
jgi:hypothetical protein